MKINTNSYKKLLIFFITIFIFNDIRVEEKFPEKCVEEECEDMNSIKRTSRASKNKDKDISKFYALLAKQTVRQIKGDNLTNTLTSISNKINEIHTSIIHNLSIVTQLGLINTNAASSALTTTLVVYDANVDAYNNDITAALLAVAAAVSTPSTTNTTTAQALLRAAINNFNNIVSDYYDRKAVLSMYSFAEIKSELAKLNAQLGYLYILQRS